MNTESELKKAFDLFLSQPKKEVKFEYRIYYDETGQINLAVSEPHLFPESGEYITVTKEQYETHLQCEVINKTLVKRFISTDYGIRPSLQKSQTGFKVIKNNPAILLDSDEEYDQVEHYDYRKN